MSNIHSIKAVGFLPHGLMMDDSYTANETERAIADYNKQELLKFIGYCSLPYIGFNFTFHETIEKVNKFKGITVYYRFEIGGEEAVNSAWLEKIYNLLNKIGVIRYFVVEDTENNIEIMRKNNILFCNNWVREN